MYAATDMVDYVINIVCAIIRVTTNARNKNHEKYSGALTSLVVKISTDENLPAIWYLIPETGVKEC